MRSIWAYRFRLRSRLWGDHQGCRLAQQRRPQAGPDHCSARHERAFELHPSPGHRRNGCAMRALAPESRSPSARGLMKLLLALVVATSTGSCNCGFDCTAQPLISGGGTSSCRSSCCTGWVCGKDIYEVKCSEVPGGASSALDGHGHFPSWETILMNLGPAIQPSRGASRVEQTENDRGGVPNVCGGPG